MKDKFTARMDALAAGYRSVDERMRGLPIHNPDLNVEVVEARRWGDFHIGILITPWCMNLVVLPPSETGSADSATGTEREFELPCGKSTFLAGDARISEPHWACSLFSPVLNFPDQAAAKAVAARIMTSLMVTPARRQVVSATHRHLTRRELIRGMPD